MGIIENQKQAILFNNPISNQLIMTFDNNSARSIVIFDSKGVEVFKADIMDTFSYSIDTEKLNSGVYYLNVTTPQSSFTRKLIK
jgi:hypothetical protein